MKRQDIEEAGRNELCYRKPQYLAVIIKPTYDCNLACTYCSVDEHVTHSTMSTQTVDKILSRVTDFCGVDKPIFLIWHGGEPLLMNPDFYEYIGQKTSTYRNYTITNSVQTNATLLNDRFLDVFTKYDFDISISLDGPEYLNDITRKDRKGTGTFRKILDSVSILRARHIPIGGIAVLTKQNLGRAHEIYEFFNKEGIHLRINPVQCQGRAARAYSDFALSSEEYGQEMIKIFDQWYHDKETRIIVDPFSIIIGNILTDTIDCCDFRRSCHSEIISIGPEGNVYPCGQFNGLEEYCFGNIYNQSFNDIMEASMMKKLLMRVPENIKKCNLCKYKVICNCGCTVSALIERGNIMDPDYYCTGRKMIFQHIIDTLENDLDRATELKSIREPKIGNYVI